MLKHCAGLVVLCTFALLEAKRVDYSGYKVLSINPKTDADLDLLHRFRNDYSVDLWNEPSLTGIPVMTHLKPDLANNVENILKNHKIEYHVAFSDLNSAIEIERIPRAATNTAQDAISFHFGKYNRYEEIVTLIQGLAAQYPDIAKLAPIGNSYENRSIYNLNISSGDSANKPAIIMECGIHAREWTSVAACVYFVNELITTYGSDPVVTSLVDKYEFNIVVEANPDGYIYTWTQDRLWRKTRSFSSNDPLRSCPGADANRNFGSDHCDVGASRKPCDEIYCGDKPFSESEARALRDLMSGLSDRLKLYVSVHAFSQLWMTPYSKTKKQPPNYDELIRVATEGANALKKRFDTVFKIGSIANIVYEVTGSSVDYAYVKYNVTMAFHLELRDQGRFGFFLPQRLILPTCEETYDGLIATIQAL